MSDFLDLDELYDVHRKLDHNRLMVYKEIYRKCLAKMKHTNDMMRKLECTFQVPSFVWGIPIYDYDELKEYILFRLHENGLINCYFIDPVNLHMSWKPEDVDKKKYQAAKKKAVSTVASNTSLIKQEGVGDVDFNNKGPIISPITLGQVNPYKRNDSRPTSTMMKFDDVFEVPVNLDKIRKLRTASAASDPKRMISKTTPSRLQPNKDLAASWKNFFNKS